MVNHDHHEAINTSRLWDLRVALDTHNGSNVDSGLGQGMRRVKLHGLNSRFGSSATQVTAGMGK